MKIIGIDPGLSGAIAILENNKVLNLFDMPVMSEGKKNKKQLNSSHLVNIIKENVNLSQIVVTKYFHADYVMMNILKQLKIFIK